ncbi:MAG: electron transporter RnfD [Deltaproteobacteria bacterium]|nr:electron transporter RnfD [Deltaproteobacteria bacterium]
MLWILLACTPQTKDAPSLGDSSDSSPLTDSDSAAPDSKGDSGDSGDTGDTAPPDTTPELIAADHANLRYIGRINASDPLAPVFHWPGSAVEAVFEGTSLTLHLDDAGTNYVSVVIDGGEPTVIACAPGENTYVVAEGLSPGAHTLRVAKRTEIAEGDLTFVGFTLDPGAELGPRPAEKALKIEFYGDSITSGYSVDCDCDSGDAVYKDNTHTYAAFTARALDADYHSVSLSGIGLVRSWWSATMVTYWDSLQNDDHAWDFAVWTPDIVVVNLGQNDYWLGVGKEMIPAWISFGRTLRTTYPDAELFFALGSMDVVAPGSPFPAMLEEAVETLQEEDEHVHAVIFEYNGSGRHPVASEQAWMAEQLLDTITLVMPELG